MGVTEIFIRLSELAQARGEAPISKFAGCWEAKLGDDVVFAVNGHTEPKQSTVTQTAVPPFHAFFMRYGFPVAIVTPSGGVQLGEDSETEDNLVRLLKEATVAAGGTPSDFHDEYEEDKQETLPGVEP